MKNVTNNTPEELIIDSTVPTANPPESDWTSTIATTWKPAATRVQEMYFDLFRRDTCLGYIGMTHIMAAAWSTDAGQRIGAAFEIEGGGGGGVTPPSAPINLTVSPSGIRLPEMDVVYAFIIALLLAGVIGLRPRRPRRPRA
jgi:hypothetical protein